MTTYPNIAEFYRARGGDRSGEVDFGVWWYEARSSAPHRISWIAETGDVYLMNHWSHKVTLLASVRDRQQVEKMLDGWAEACGARGSLLWARSRLAKHAPVVDRSPA